MQSHGKRGREQSIVGHRIQIVEMLIKSRYLKDVQKFTLPIPFWANVIVYRITFSPQRAWYRWGNRHC